MKLMSMLIILLFGAQALALVVGEVDVQKVLVSVNEGKKVRAELEKEFKKRQEEIQKEEKAIQEEQQKLQKQAAVLEPPAIQARERKINEMAMNLQRKTMEHQKTINEMEQQKKAPILNKLEPVMVEVSKKANVDITFEMSSTPIIYAKEKKDLTDEVITEYNKKHK